MKSIQFLGQDVTAEQTKDSPTGWCVTGWQKGPPVCRKPITGEAVAELMRRFDHVVRTV